MGHFINLRTSSVNQWPQYATNFPRFRPHNNFLLVDNSKFFYFSLSLESINTFFFYLLQFLHFFLSHSLSRTLREKKNTIFCASRKVSPPRKTLNNLSILFKFLQKNKMALSSSRILAMVANLSAPVQKNNQSFAPNPS